MQKYAKKYYKIDQRNLICETVQNFGFHHFLNKVSCCICWWNACYLKESELKPYFFSMILALRCDKGKEMLGTALSFNGYIILAEPIGDQCEKNDFQGQSMVIRTAEFYETFLLELNLEVVHRKDYEGYAADDRHMIYPERVWILRESPCSLPKQ